MFTHESSLLSSTSTLQIPVWVGGCGWQEFVPKYNKDPSQYPQVLQYLQQGLTQAAKEIELPDQNGDCPDINNARDGLLAYWESNHTSTSSVHWLTDRYYHPDCDTTPSCSIYGSQAQKTLTYVPNTLKMAIGGDNASTIVSAQINVQVSVPFQVRDCEKSWFFRMCECDTVCGGGSTMVESFSMVLTMQTPCTVCPMPPAVTPSGTIVTAKILGNPNVEFHGCDNHFNKYVRSHPFLHSVKSLYVPPVGGCR